MNLRIRIYITVLFVWTGNNIFSQAPVNPYHSLSIGIAAGHLGDDGSLGIEAASPFFLHNRFCVRVKGNIHWLEHYKALYDRRVIYESAGTSLIYNTVITERARVFVDLGTFFIFPDRKFSEVKTVQGISAAIGVELFLFTPPHGSVCYFFSGGAAYCHAYAEKLEGTPRYGNGVTFSNGFRVYF